MSIENQLTTIIDNVPKVYEAGEKAEYDKFWDRLQKNGTLKNYKYVFAGRSWHPDIFKPKYDMKPTTVTSMFSEFGADTTKIVDITDVLEKQGVLLDTSLATSFSNFANSSNIKRFPTIDTRATTSIMGAFSNSAIETIDELILKDEGTQSFSAAFDNTTKLKNIIISGVIGSAISFKSSKLLTKASITSIINALSENLTATKTITLSKTAVYNHFSDDGENLNSEWSELIKNKTKWSIAFA